MSAPKHATYLTDDIGPLPFCPGCGHDPLLKALDRALVELQPDPAKVVIVTDIGCIGLADRYFTTSAFHGLHGRSLTYATGLKLARPELTVIVLKGDGGCGIGGAHLLNAARRNVGLTLIVANNFNYGMTGGQHSVTTPGDAVTATTPLGNIEGAIDLCGAAIAAGASWAYRGTVHDEDIAARIAEAIRQPGFAMLDVWEMCTAYYLPRNKMNKKELAAMIERCGLGAGLLAERPRPEYSARYREIHAVRPAARRAILTPSHGHNLQTRKGIVIAGGAGQKIRSAAGLFAQAAMLAGLSATQKDDYPITIMTGHSVSEVIVSPHPIDYTAIDAPDSFIVVSEDGLKKTKARIRELPQTCTLFAEETLQLPETAARVVRLPFAAAAKSVNRLSIGVVALAAVLAETEMFAMEALEEAITSLQRAEIAETNLRATQAGGLLVKGV